MNRMRGENGKGGAIKNDKKPNPPRAEGKEPASRLTSGQLPPESHVKTYVSAPSVNV